MIVPTHGACQICRGRRKLLSGDHWSANRKYQSSGYHVMPDHTVGGRRCLGSKHPPIELSADVLRQHAESLLEEVEAWVPSFSNGLITELPQTLSHTAHGHFLRDTKAKQNVEFPPGWTLADLKQRIEEGSWRGRFYIQEGYHSATVHFSNESDAIKFKILVEVWLETEVTA